MLSSKTLFRTIHGSHLYGLAHEGSDEDYYEVVADNPTVQTRYSRQTIRDGIDTTLVDLSTWLHYVDMGVPQACEAMFSTKADIDLLGDLRASYRLTSQSWDRYLRTALSFVANIEDFKRVRHGVRLALNLYSIRERGRFDPTLTPGEIERINQVAANIEVGFIEPTSTIHAISGIGR